MTQMDIASCLLLLLLLFVIPGSDIMVAMTGGSGGTWCKGAAATILGAVENDFVTQGLGLSPFVVLCLAEAVVACLLVDDLEPLDFLAAGVFLL